MYRPEITQKVTWAASLGDRSENADYQYNKKLLREIDRRVRYLRKRLEDVKVVALLAAAGGQGVFRCLGGDRERRRRDHEVSHCRGMTRSMGAMTTSRSTRPMARALLKKEEGDEVVVHTPTGEATWYVNSISYGQ
ncbi:transcription elongation factor GreB [Pseudomonas putida S11]|nr:transcription elongation factor GreB [Pseudomonas putida S11]